MFIFSLRAKIKEFWIYIIGTIERKDVIFMQNLIVQSDALKYLKTLPNDSVNCIITSPPYYNLRDYGVDGQIGLEKHRKNTLIDLPRFFERLIEF